MCLSKHVEQLRNTGIINSTIRSHFVGYFCKIYIMMHWSMNIKSSIRFAGYLQIIWYFEIYIDLFHAIPNNVFRYSRLERLIQTNNFFFLSVPEFTFSLEIRKWKRKCTRKSKAFVLRRWKFSIWPRKFTIFWKPKTYYWIYKCPRLISSHNINFLSLRASYKFVSFPHNAACRTVIDYMFCFFLICLSSEKPQ
jgi:hypothetical protein